MPVYQKRLSSNISFLNKYDFKFSLFKRVLNKYEVFPENSIYNFNQNNLFPLFSKVSRSKHRIASDFILDNYFVKKYFFKNLVLSSLTNNKLNKKNNINRDFFKAITLIFFYEPVLNNRIVNHGFNPDNFLDYSSFSSNLSSTHLFKSRFDFNKSSYLRNYSSLLEFWLSFIPPVFISLIKTSQFYPLLSMFNLKFISGYLRFFEKFIIFNNCLSFGSLNSFYKNIKNSLTFYSNSTYSFITTSRRLYSFDLDSVLFSKNLFLNNLGNLSAQVSINQKLAYWLEKNNLLFKTTFVSLLITGSKNNFFLTLVDNFGNVIWKVSSGSVGFSGKQRKTPESLRQMLKRFVAMLRSKNIIDIYVFRFLVVSGVDN